MIFYVLTYFLQNILLFHVPIALGSLSLLAWLLQAFGGQEQDGPRARVPSAPYPLAGLMLLSSSLL